MFRAAATTIRLFCVTLLVGLWLALPKPVLAQTTVTVMQGQNGYAGTTDAKIACCSYADANFGADTFYALIPDDSTSLLIRFAIFQSEGGPVPNGASVTSATLSFYKYWGPATVFKVNRVLRNWNQSSVTWNNTGAGSAWATPGVFSGDILSTPDGQGTVGDAQVDGCSVSSNWPASCWLNIDVTSGVQAFASGTANDGWKMAYVSDADGGTTYSHNPKEFNSSENTSWPTLRPKLTITYQGGPTAQLTATPSSGAPPLVVNFSAAGSTPGGAAITSLRLQFGDGSADVTWSDKNQGQSHTYSAAGTYTATLTVTDANNLSSTDSKTIQVSTGPTACSFPSPLAASGVAVATFHSMGLYYNPPSPPSGDQIFVRYRRGTDDPNGSGVWKQGHPLWYDARNVQTYHGRGSVVHLNPGTPYVFEVGIGADYGSATWQHHIPGPTGDAGEPCPTTWSETFPVGPTLTPWTGTKTSTTSSPYKGARSGSTRSHVLLADQSGTPNGYTLYDFTGTSAIAQAPNSSNYFPVVISGSYIIVRGLKTVGGESGIFIDPGSHDIVIENCDITGYARDSGAALGSGLSGNQGVNEDAGVKFPDSSYGPVLDTKRIVIQRSWIHNPAFGTHPWDSGHPAGPSPITMYPTGGQIVIRYNTVYATTNGQPDGPPDFNHFHQDGLILGGDNNQGIGPDIDIYKNLVLHYFDDGLETDGDGTNVRVWKNYFDYGGASAVSTTPTFSGPAYVWRNVYNRARMWFTDPWGNERDRLYMMKVGGLDGANGGRRYIYHNTSLQPPYTSESTATGPQPLGAGFGAGGNGGVNAMQNTVTRNNVFEIWKPWWSTFDLTGASGNDLDYDLTNGSMSEAHGVQSTPQYQAGNGWSAYWGGGRYRLQPGTPGYDDGVVLPNFNDGYVGTGPDRGAHEDGTADMDFGTTATGS